MLFSQTRYNNATMHPIVKVLKVILLVGLLITVTDIPPVSAQAGSAADLINAVNSLRQSLGLAPYAVDSYLMGFAQSHSDYMKSLGTWTHTRADGSRSFDYGIKENVAMGTNMSVAYCVNTVWSDWVHWETMTGYAEGKVGAGVAISDQTVYYTLNVLPEGSSVAEPVSNPSEAQSVAAIGMPLAQNTPIPIAPVALSTPNEDGIIIHIVQYGETLWSIAIAYDVKIDQILRNSNLNPTTTTVYEKQKLVIQAATESTATSTFTPTVDPGTPTPTQPQPTRTPFPTRTPAPTQTPTQPPSLIQRTFGNGKILGIGLILISGLGLFFVIYLGFIKKP